MPATCPISRAIRGIHAHHKPHRRPQTMGLNCDVGPLTIKGATRLLLRKRWTCGPPLTASLRAYSGQKPRARQRAWPGYGAIPCTVRTVTGHIPGAGGRRRGRPHAMGRRDQRPQTTGDRRLARPQATGRRSSRPAATHRPGPETTSTRVRLRRPPLRARRQHVSDRRRRGWWKRKLGRGSRSQKAGASS